MLHSINNQEQEVKIFMKVLHFKLKRLTIYRTSWKFAYLQSP